MYHNLPRAARFWPFPAVLRGAYIFVRMVEGRLRLLENRSVSHLPSSPAELERLAHRPSDEPAARARAVPLFLAETDRVTR
jgi:glutamine synthetase adenylyltransferase